MQLRTRVDTYTTYCDNLPPPHDALGSLLHQRLSAQGWASSLAALNIAMMVPPTRRLHKSLLDGLPSYEAWYAKLPLSRWTRQRSVLEITLAAPALAAAMRKKDKSESELAEITQTYLSKNADDGTPIRHPRPATTPIPC